MASPPSAPSRRAAETELLLLCARLTLAPSDAARVRALAAGPLDWDRLVELGDRHGLLAFLHRHLAGETVAAPPAAAAELRARFRDAAHQGLSLAGELRRLLDALAEGGVEALAYKGPALAVQAYGDLSLRSFVDLDVLVSPDAAPRALEVLRGEGYDPVRALTAAQDRCFRRVDGDYQLRHRESGTLVELHCRVSSLRFAMPLETGDLLRRAVALPLGGGVVPAPAPDDALLVSCIHGAKHRWHRLEWLCAVAEPLRAGSADAQAVLARAAGLHARRTVLLGLELARRLLDAPLPPGVLADISRDPAVAALADRAEGRMLS
ncbi:MAG TPA: nucleotidyltransferase family protein, partial [Longimicrobiaceae bacterium]|nr:nucleotidyltransferase family protein [Longimicrobiaceae bacterium]